MKKSLRPRINFLGLFPEQLSQHTKWLVNDLSQPDRSNVNISMM